MHIEALERGELEKELLEALVLLEAGPKLFVAAGALFFAKCFDDGFEFVHAAFIWRRGPFFPSP